MNRIAVMGLVAATISSCALLKRAEAPRDTYELSAPRDVAGSGGTRAQLLVKVPTALKSIDSDRIVVRTSPSVITYLAGAQWSDTVPRMVQAKLVEAFENTGATGATAKPGDGLVIDYQLVIDIRRFGILEGTTPRARLEVSVKLLTDKTGVVRETRIFEAETNASGDTPEAYVAAMDRAFGDLTRDLVRWVLGAV